MSDPYTLIVNQKPDFMKRYSKKVSGHEDLLRLVDDWEIRFWSNLFHCSQMELKVAARALKYSAKAIKEYFLGDEQQDLAVS